MSFGAKLFYPRFTNHGDLLHLGTREIQLVLFKVRIERSCNDNVTAGPRQGAPPVYCVRGRVQWPCPRGRVHVAVSTWREIDRKRGDARCANERIGIA